MAEGRNTTLLTYVREKEEAREEVKRVEQELAATKSKLQQKVGNGLREYDYGHRSRMKKSKRKLQIKTLEASKAPAKSQPAKAANGKANPGKKAAPQSQGKKTGAPEKKPSLVPPTDTSPSSRPGSGVVRHPPIPGKESLSQDSAQYYREIGKMFPDIKLSVVMDAESKFNQADINGDGQIDKDELDRVLTQHVTLFTPAMIQELIKEIDQDNNDTLEFPEILMAGNDLPAQWEA
uniref:Fimbrin n=1 Tax=Magallana gigas TaxID=29159 RepID=K1R974_MAGGI